MPDPIDELESFAMPPLNPLPPTEVRRRGDRIRRRRNALVAVGSVAAVAIIAAPIAVLAQRQGPSEPQPMPAPSRTTQVPETFDVTAVPAGSPLRFEVGSSLLEDVVPCGTGGFSTLAHDDLPDASDVLGASVGEQWTESTDVRTLALYDDDETASRALAELRAAVLACPEDTHGRTTYRWAVVDAPTVGQESLVISQQVPFDATLLSDLTLIQVVREGNALLLASTHTSAGGDQAIAETLPALTELTAPVVDQLCTFSPEGC